MAKARTASFHVDEHAVSFQTTTGYRAEMDGDIHRLAVELSQILERAEIASPPRHHR